MQTCNSPKFFAKIVYISTLSELAYHVPLTQIDIPPAVYKCVPMPPWRLRSSIKVLTLLQGKPQTRSVHHTPSA